jgi:putative DNA primase/helicase
MHGEYTANRGGRKSHSSANSNINAAEQFREAAAQRGLVIKDLIADGEVHRCDVEGKNGKGDGAYCLHLDGIPAGWFQNHKDGAGVRRWHARTGRKLNDAEVAAHKAKVRAQQAQREAELEKEHVRTAARATTLVENNPDADDLHLYFVRKKVKAPRGIKHSATPVAISPWRNSAADVLIAPACDIDGTLWNVQVVDARGRKDFLKDSRKAGCFFVVGATGGSAAGTNPNGLNLIVEGLATGATCFEAMDVPVVVAFDAGNLLAVARALQDRYRKAKFVICGDDDWKSKGNPGKAYAMRAARAIGAEVAFPIFPPAHHREDGETDFNDLAAVAGLGEVRRCIEAAELVEKIKARADENDAPVQAEIERLAALSDIDYELARKDAAKRLKVRPTFPDKMVNKAKSEAPDPAAKKPPPVEPWPQAVDGGELLRELMAAIRAHVVMDEVQCLAVALWIIHAHAHDAAAISAILASISPQRRCGKTTLLSLLQELTPNPLMASNITAAAVFRAIAEWAPTLIVDEADTFLAKNDELRGIINSGHNRRAAFVVRVVEVGKKLSPVKFSTWAPKIIASIGDLSDTLQDRSIAIRLRRKLPGDPVQKFRADRVQHLTNLCRMVARWVQDHLEELRKRDAPVPGKLHDRAADNWRALLGIADLIGGKWAAKARAAALALEETGDKADTKDLAIRLLADLRSIFDRDKRKEYLSAEHITGCLANIDESPWPDYRNGKPINSNGFARLLEPFEIYSRKVTTGPDKGNMRWYRADFEDTWTRYLPQEGAESTARASTASTALKNKANPVSPASTAGEACDGEKAKDFNGVESVEAQNGQDRSSANFNGSDPSSGHPPKDDGDVDEPWGLDDL